MDYYSRTCILMAKNYLLSKKPFDMGFNTSNGSLWLGMRDSNPRMPGPEPGALPLGESPTKGSHCHYITKAWKI